MDNERKELLRAILRRAAELIRAGWCKGKLARWKSSASGMGLPDARNSRVEDCRFCALGAITRAVHEKGIRKTSEAAGLVIDSADCLVAASDGKLSSGRIRGEGGSFSKISIWNDSHGRKRSEVLALFRKAADGLEVVL